MALPISRHSLGVSAVATVADDGKVGNVPPLRTYRAAPLGSLVVTPYVLRLTSDIRLVGSGFFAGQSGRAERRVHG